MSGGLLEVLLAARDAENHHESGLFSSLCLSGQISSGHCAVHHQK